MLGILPNKMLMKAIILFIVLIFVIPTLKASEPNKDTTYWKSKYESAISFSQTGMHNWTKGGEGSFSVFISPVGARLTVVADTSLTHRKGGAYGISGDNFTLWQVGGSINAIFKKDILKNINLMSKLDVFSNYRDNPEKIIVGWENNILMKVNKYISVNLSTMLIYDDKAIVKKNSEKFKDIVQFRETFGIGLAYTIFH